MSGGGKQGAKATLDATRTGGEDSVKTLTLITLVVPQEGNLIFWLHDTFWFAALDGVRASCVPMLTNT